MAIDQNILVACDTILLTPDHKVLLIKRGFPPYQGMCALPGGFAEDGEDLHETAARELLEETSIALKAEDLVQLGTYGRPGRDPRGRTVSVVYYHLLARQVDAQAGDDAADAAWYSIHDLPKMAFDHRQVMDDFLSQVVRRG